MMVYNKGQVVRSAALSALLPPCWPEDRAPVLISWLTYGSQGGGAISGPVLVPGMNHAVGTAEGVSLLTAFHLDFGYGWSFT